LVSDVIVIGSGVIGCAIASELSRRGAGVEVLDSRPIGMGATQASAGILAPYLEAREGSPLLDIAVRSLALYDDFVARAAEESGVAVPYRRTGTLDVAFDDRELRELQETARVLAARGVAASLVDGEGARREEPHVGEDVAGALLVDAHGFVAASDLTRALAAGARQHGAKFLEQCHVRAIGRQDPDVVVETDKGSLRASAVVLAAGSWSGQVAIHGTQARVPVRPVRGQLLSLAWRGTPLRRVTWSGRCYLVPWDNNTVLVGATAEEAGFDERATVAGVRDLLEGACDVTPHAWTAGFREARVGLRPATPDGLPVLGLSTAVDGLIYATGHFRNGILLAPLTAALVADALVEGRADAIPASLAPSRFGEL
jgi:glycine oxidase